MTCGQKWWPILGICALHLTHPSAHTHTVNTHRSSGQPYCCGARVTIGGSVSCSRVSPQSWYWRWKRALVFTPKSKWLDNWDCLGFWGLTKKKKKEWIFIIVGWLCPHTAKTHLYANEDILHPVSPLKLKYYRLILIQVMKDFKVWQ